jgi:hypothetical protein
MQPISKKMLLLGGLALVVTLASGVSVASAKSDKSNLSPRERAVQAKLKRTTPAPKAHKRTIPGKVISITPETVTVTDANTGASTTSYFSMVIRKGNKHYTVHTTATTGFVDRKWKPIAKTDILVGHKVTIKGMVTGTEVVANWVRDVGLPAKSTTAE